MSKSTFIIGRLQTACAVECPLPGIRVAGGEDSFDNSDNVVVRQQSPVAGILQMNKILVMKYVLPFLLRRGQHIHQIKTNVFMINLLKSPIITE